MCINSLTQIKEKQTLTIPSIDNDVKQSDSTYRNINRRKAASLSPQITTWLTNAHHHQWPITLAFQRLWIGHHVWGVIQFTGKNRDVCSLLPFLCRKNRKRCNGRNGIQIEYKMELWKQYDQGNVDSVAFKTCTGVFTTIYKIENWLGKHTVQGNLYRKGVSEWVDLCICMANPLC